MTDTTTSLLTMWVITYNTSDYPGMYVVRPWTIEPGKLTPITIGTAVYTIDQARDVVPPGLYCFPRSLIDDPVIVESWM